MRGLRVALAQFNPTVGDLSGNAAAIEAGMSRARRRQADIVLFPELSLCGYPPEDLLLRPGFLRDCRETLEELAQHSGRIAAVVGVPWREQGRVYNAAAVLGGGRLAGLYFKRELPNYGVFDEKRYFWPGTGALLLRIGDALLALTICEDVWLKGGPVEQAVRRMRPDAVLNLSASPFHAGKVRRRTEVLSGFAERCGAWLCYCNLVGGQDELVFGGGSTVFDAAGQVVARGQRFCETMLLADLQIAREARRTDPEVRSSGDAELIELDAAPAEREPVSHTPAPELGEVEEIYDALVLGLSDYVSKNGFEKAVLGLSGGIDSSLGAAIAVDALGEENVVGVTMPSRFTSGETFSDAGTLAHNLGIRLLTVPVRRIFSAYGEELEELLGDSGEGVAYENLQARIRGNILMALSNRFGWLVLSTGNKSELAVGYCTLYGDMCGGFAVIKDVPKTMVYRLARYFNEKSGREVIPESVLRRAPSAELKEGQKDQDVLPPYEVLDPVLTAYVEEDRMPAEIAARAADFDVVRQVVRMVDRSEYKRRQAPPGIKITPRAFGKDRRLPITNRYAFNGAEDR